MILRSQIKDKAREKGFDNANQLSTQARVGYRSVSAIWEYDTPIGDTKIITLEKIARALGVTVTELYIVLGD